MTSDATKPEIRDAVELLFKVKVKGVTVVNVRVSANVSGLLSGDVRIGKNVYLGSRQ